MSTNLGIGLSVTRPTRGFDPARLFADGEQGAWYDPSDFATLYQDSAGTTPVTALGQPVGLMLDKAQGGKPTGPELVTNGTFDSGTTGWSSFTNSGTSNISVANGELIVTTSLSQGNSGARQVLSGLTAGTWYEITLDARVISSGSGEAIDATVRWADGNVTTGFSRIAGTASTTTSTPVTALRGVFLAASSQATIFLINGGVGNTGSTYICGYDNISVREIPGNHASQSISTARPTVQARVNLLERTEELDDVYWSKSVGVSVTANQAIAPDGSLTADLVNKTSTSGFRAISEGVTNLITDNDVTFSLYLKSGTAPETAIGLVDNTVGTFRFLATVTWTAGVPSVTGGVATVESVGDGWYRLSSSSSAIVPGNNHVLAIYPAATGAETGTVYLWGAQLEQGSTATTYQRVTTATDYEDIGLPRYLEFDGVDDYLTSGTASDWEYMHDGSGVDIVLGVTPANTPSPETLNVFMGTAAPVSTSKGLIVAAEDRSAAENAWYAYSPRGVSLQNLFTLSTNGSIADMLGRYVFRVTHATSSSPNAATFADGSLVASTAYDNAATTGASSYPLNIGRTGDGLNYLSGKIFQAIVRDTVTSGNLLDQLERFVARKTGVTL